MWMDNLNNSLCLLGNLIPSFKTHSFVRTTKKETSRYTDLTVELHEIFKGEWDLIENG